MTIMKEPIKVLVVDDSAFMRKILSDMLQSDPMIQVIGTARNGQEAVEKVRQLKPDLVTMDVEMPIMNGLEALKQIMETSPLPVVMLSSLTSEGADATIMALEAGAVDFIQKPSSVFMVNGDILRRELIQKIKIASRVQCTRGVCFPPFTKGKEEIPSSPPVIKRSMRREERAYAVGGQSSNFPLVAIGTSTGGPKALQSVIPLISADTPAAYLIVQHMPPGFTKSLADRLNSHSAIRVKEAEHGEPVLPGTAYVAPGDDHLMVKQDQHKQLFIHLEKSPPVSGHRPSVDVMVQSLTAVSDHPVIGVIMTGMGADGARGLKELKEKKRSYIIAQNEDTCVVYGMPKSTVKLGVVDEITPLERIAASIQNRLEGL